jgi:hypothetical protein
MGTFLDQFLDTVQVEPGHWQARDEEQTQQTRLLCELVSVRHAMEMKRRLGPDASPPELSADKKIAKMVYNRLLTAYETWGADPTNADDVYNLAKQAEREEWEEEEMQMEEVFNLKEVDLPELLIQGAQIDWDAWWQAKKAFLRQHVRFVANNAVANNDRKNGNRFANRFANEYNSIGDVLDPVSGAEREHKFDAI